MNAGYIRDLLRGTGDTLEKPVVLQFPVIDICNSRCQMCHIWQRKKEDYLSPEAIRLGLSDPLFSNVRAVGLNGGEPTLRSDLAEVTRSLFDALPALRSVNLITNGFKVDQVIDRIGEVAEVAHAAGGKLELMVSLDGYGAVHDAVRGKPGNFERCVRLLDWAQAACEVDNLRIGCTIIRENAYGLHRLLQFCLQRDLYIKYRIGIPHRRLYTGDLAEPYELNADELRNVVDFLDGLVRHYEPDARQRHFYRSLIAQLRDGAPRAAGCDWRHRGATLSSRGEVAYCAVESPVVGQLGGSDLGSRYFGSEAALEGIKASKCADCRHDYVGLPSRRERLRIVADDLHSSPRLGAMIERLADLSGVRELRARRRFARYEAKMAGRPPARVSASRPPFLICGWYGTETLGDKAILGAVVQVLSELEPDTPVAVASLDPGLTAQTCRQMPELGGLRVLSIDDALGAASTARAVIFGGGPLMGIDELVPMRRMFELARENGRPALIAGCGVGPIGAKRHETAIASILELATARVFRDDRSRRAAIALHPGCANDAVAADPAASWIASRLSSQPKPERPSLVLGLRAFPWHQYATHLGRAQGEALREACDEAVREALRAVCAARPALRVQPVPMCTNPAGGDDRWYYQKLFAKLPDLTDRIEWDLVERQLAPSDYLGIFAGAAAVLAMRFHSLVFALECGAPAVAIDYTLGRGKVAALAQREGVPVQSLDALDPDVLRDDLLVALDALPRPRQNEASDFAGTFARVAGTALSES